VPFESESTFPKIRACQFDVFCYRPSPEKQGEFEERMQKMQKMSTARLPVILSAMLVVRVRACHSTMIS